MIEGLTGQKLYADKSKRGNLLLYLTNVNTNTRVPRASKRTGQIGKIRAKYYIRKTKGGSTYVGRRSVRKDVRIPVFLILKNTRLPKRLNFTQVVQEAPVRFEEKFLIELARRRVI